MNYFSIVIFVLFVVDWGVGQIPSIAYSVADEVVSTAGDAAGRGGVEDINNVDQQAQQETIDEMLRKSLGMIGGASDNEEVSPNEASASSSKQSGGTDEERSWYSYNNQYGSSNWYGGNNEPAVSDPYRKWDPYYEYYYPPAPSASNQKREESSNTNYNSPWPTQNNWMNSAYYQNPEADDAEKQQAAGGVPEAVSRQLDPDQNDKGGDIPVIDVSRADMDGTDTAAVNSIAAQPIAPVVVADNKGANNEVAAAEPNQQQNADVDYEYSNDRMGDFNQNQWNYYYDTLPIIPVAAPPTASPAQDDRVDIGAAAAIEPTPPPVFPAPASPSPRVATTAGQVIENPFYGWMGGTKASPQADEGDRPSAIVGEIMGNLAQDSGANDERNNRTEGSAKITTSHGESLGERHDIWFKIQTVLIERQGLVMALILLCVFPTCIFCTVCAVTKAWRASVKRRRVRHYGVLTEDIVEHHQRNNQGQLDGGGGDMEKGELVEEGCQTNSSSDDVEITYRAKQLY